MALGDYRVDVHSEKVQDTQGPPEDPQAQQIWDEYMKARGRAYADYAVTKENLVQAYFRGVLTVRELVNNIQSEAITLTHTVGRLENKFQAAANKYYDMKEVASIEEVLGEDQT